MARDPLDRAFTALADRSRRRVVELLRTGPRRAGELAAALRMSPPALTRHLRVLREGRLVDELVDAQDARVRVYRLRKEALAALRAWVDDVEAMWAEQLAAFAAYAAAAAAADDAGKPKSAAGRARRGANGKQPPSRQSLRA